MPFVKDGLELVIDTGSGEAFASIRATARMVEKDASTVQRFIGVAHFDLKSAEINTGGGVQGVAEDAIVPSLVSRDSDRRWKAAEVPSIRILFCDLC
jgi:hypothetical protein